MVETAAAAAGDAQLAEVRDKAVVFHHALVLLKRVSCQGHRLTRSVCGLRGKRFAPTYCDYALIRHAPPQPLTQHVPTFAETEVR